MDNPLAFRRWRLRPRPFGDEDRNKNSKNPPARPLAAPAYGVSHIFNNYLTIVTLRPDPFTKMWSESGIRTWGGPAVPSQMPRKVPIS